MSSVWRRFLGLCIPPLAFCAFDASITLAGQSADYWSGNYAEVNEASPTFNHLLHIHPTAFAVGTLAWAAMFASIIRAPMTSILIIFEMTGGYGLVLPLMVANMTAYALARYWRRTPIYEALLLQDGNELPHGKPVFDDERAQSGEVLP